MEFHRSERYHTAVRLWLQITIRWFTSTFSPVQYWQFIHLRPKAHFLYCPNHSTVSLDTNDLWVIDIDRILKWKLQETQVNYLECICLSWNSLISRWNFCNYPSAVSDFFPRRCIFNIRLFLWKKGCISFRSEPPPNITPFFFFVCQHLSFHYPGVNSDMLGCMWSFHVEIDNIYTRPCYLSSNSKNVTFSKM